MKALFIAFSVSFIFWMGYRIVANIQAKQTYIGYLKRAADANSIELAKNELGRAISEIERRGLTSGYTSILWKTPDDDLGFWYQNLKTSLQELEALDQTASPLEKSNMLIKLRETLLDSDEDGDTVTRPEGISIYPANALIAIWGTASFICAVVFGCLYKSSKE